MNVAVSVKGLPSVNGANPLQIVEMQPDGLCRVTWLGTTSKPGQLQLLAEGYESEEVPAEVFETTSAIMSIGGALSEGTIRMRAK